MTVGTPLPFDVEKKALRPSGSNSFFRGKTPSIVRPSYSVHSSIEKFQSSKRIQDRKPRTASATLSASNNAKRRPGRKCLAVCPCHQSHYHSSQRGTQSFLLTAQVHEVRDLAATNSMPV